MALVTRILLVACLILAIQGASLNLDQDAKTAPKLEAVEVSSKDATSIIKAAINKKGIHFGTNDKITFSKSPEKVTGVAIHDIAEGGTSKHAVQRPVHVTGNALKTLSSIKSPLVRKDKIHEMKQSKEIKFIVNNKKTTNFEVSTIKNEIFGRGNIRLEGNGHESFPKSEGGNGKFIRKKESVSAVFSDKDAVPVISMNIHNLNAPNEGLIYVNSPKPTAVRAERNPGNYILVNVSGEPALIPSILLGKTGLIPKEKILNNTEKVTGLPFFNFWPEHPVKIPNDNIVKANDAILEQFKGNKTHPKLLKERLKHLEAFLKEGLAIPKLQDGSFDWDKITSHVIKDQPEVGITTKRPEVTTKQESSVDQRKQFLLDQLQKYGIRIPRHPSGSVDWDEIGVILEKLEHDSTTKNPVEFTKKPIAIVTNEPELMTTTTKTPEVFDFQKQYLLNTLSKLGIPIPKRLDGSIDWEKVIAHLTHAGKGDIVEVTTKPTVTPQMKEISNLYLKLGLQLPKKPNGDIDWVDAYKYLVTLQKETRKPIDRKPSEEGNNQMHIIQQLSNLGLTIPKLPNGQIDWQAIYAILNNRGTTERPSIEIPTTKSSKGVIVLGKTDLLSTFNKLGLPTPKKADGSQDWDAIIKYLIEHGYKVETGKITGNDFGVGDHIDMSLAGRLELLQRLQNLGLPIPKLSNGKIDWQSIYEYLISNGYKINGNEYPGGLNINNLGVMERLKLLEKMKNSGTTIPKLANGNLDWDSISKYFANNDGSLNLELINRMSVQDRLKLLNQMKGLGIPLYTLPNGQYDWARILQVVRDRGYKLTGTVIIVNRQPNDIASKLTADDKMQLLREVMGLRLPVPRLPGGGIDWNGVVAELRRTKLGQGLNPRPGLMNIFTNLLG